MMNDIDADLQPLLLKVAQDPFARTIGIELLDVAPGHSRVALTLEDRHLNSLGIAHGATIFALADQAFALASNSHGMVAVALDVSISFLAAARKGERLIAEATEKHLGNRTALYHIDVRSENGTLIASCQGTVYRKQKPLAEAQLQRT